MMHGIVMDIKKNKAVILKNDGSVEETVNHNYTIGQKINIASHPYRKYVLAAACFVLCFAASISGYALYTTPCSYVYLDINPSLRLDINCFDRVITVVPLNDDAEILINAYHFKSKDTENCIGEIVAACREKSYLNEENNEVEVDVLTTKKNLTNKIDNSVEKLHQSNVNVVLQKIGKEENSEAIKYKTSPKRLKAIAEYTKTFGGDVEENVSKLRGTKVKDIYAEIENKNGQSADTAKQKQNISADKSNVNTDFSGSGENRTSADTKEDVKKTPSHDTNIDENGKKGLDLPNKRDAAIEEYTKIFGGTTEENSKKLKGKTVKEIYGLMQQGDENEAEGNAVSGKNESEKPENSKKNGKSEKNDKNSDEKHNRKKQKSETNANSDESPGNTAEPNRNTANE